MDLLVPFLLRFGGSCHFTLLQVRLESEKLFSLEQLLIYNVNFISFPASAIIPEEDIVIRTPNGIEARRSNNFLKHFSFSLTCIIFNSFSNFFLDLYFHFDIDIS